jgi:hypothetical protein
MGDRCTDMVGNLERPVRGSAASVWWRAFVLSSKYVRSTHEEFQAAQRLDTASYLTPLWTRRGNCTRPKAWPDDKQRLIPTRRNHSTVPHSTQRTTVQLYSTVLGSLDLLGQENVPTCRK